LKIPKEKPIKSIRIKTHLNISIMYPLGTKEKKIIPSGLLKTIFNSNPSKVHNYHLVKVLLKMISHLTL